MSSYIVESYKLEEFSSGLLNDCDLTKDDPEALSSFIDKFKAKFSDGIEASSYEFSEEALSSFFQQFLNDLLDETLLSLVDKGVVDMSVDNDGEMLFKLKDQ